MGSNIKASNKTIEFVTAWEQRSVKQQKRFVVILVFSLILAIIICDTGFYWFQGESKDRIIKQSMNYLQDSSLKEVSDLELHMDDAVGLIQKSARQYAVLEHDYPETSVEYRLRLLWDESQFDRVAYVDLDGNDTSALAASENGPGIVNVNIADREYFQSAKNDGQSGYCFLGRSRATGKSVIVFYTPIYQAGRISGVMLGFYERQRIDHQLSYEFMNYQSDTYLLLGDGTVIGSSNDLHIGVNMLDVLSRQEYAGESDYATIRECIESPERTSVTFTFAENKEVSVGVISQFAHSDMMVVSVMPNDITDMMIANANRSGRTLMLSVTFAFLILIVLFSTFIIRQRRRMKTEMMVATQTLKETLSHDRQQLSIVESLASTYSSVYFVDLASKHYVRIKEDEISVHSIPREGDWFTGYGSYVENFVDSAFREKMMEYYDVDTFAANAPDELAANEYQRRDGKWRKGYMIPAQRDENGKILSVLFAVQRIEAQKKAELKMQSALKQAYEGAQQANTAKTIFLSNISHDIRTPMNAIVGMTAIAGANVDNRDKVVDCLKKITVASKHLLGIINEVLDMSKIETGRVDLSEEDFHLPDLLDELISIHQPLIQAKEHTLTVKVNAIEHEDVTGDAIRLQQVFTNMLTNAIKYTPKGGKLEITVSEKPTNKPNIGWYEVIFRDNGIGMSEEFQKSIFEPFTRAKDQRVTGIQGTGLGMTIARNIIRMMNGDIKVESRINEGSVFTVSFALKLQANKEIDYSAFTQLPVLVVDDDPVSCQSTCGMLDSLSMQSEYVTSGRAAIEKVAQRHSTGDDYYAVIVDWQMPDMDGVATTRAIRKQVGDAMPIIVISAYDWSQIELEAKEAGVDAFLSKPLFKSRLLKLFSEFVQSESDTVGAEQNSEIPENTFAGKRILLAEDNTLNQEIAVELFSMMGIETQVAENGKRCYDLFVASECGEYDLIFMDIQMPVMNGYEAASSIRACDHPEAKTIPIIAMSANAFSSDVRAAYDAGMNGHIAKPIDITALIKILKAHLTL